MKLKGFLFVILMLTTVLSYAQEGVHTVNLQPTANSLLISLTGYTTKNYGDYVRVRTKAWTNGGRPVNHRTLFQFDLNSIPNNAVIEEAVLHLTGIDHYPLNKSNVSRMYLVEENWGEYTVNWDNQPKFRTDVYAEVPATTYGQKSNENRDVDLTDIVRMWHSGVANNGLLFKLINEVYYSEMNFYAANAENASNRPRLEVKYTIPSFELITWDPDRSNALVPDKNTVSKVEVKTGWNNYSVGKTKLYKDGQGWMQFTVLNNIDNYNIGYSDVLTNEEGAYDFGVAIRANGEEPVCFLEHVYVNNNGYDLGIELKILDEVKLAIEKQEDNSYQLALYINGQKVDLASYGIEPVYQHTKDLYLKTNIYNVEGSITNVKYNTSGRVFYVNDNSQENDLWSRAIGNNENDGLSDLYPMASLSAILSKYQLSGNDKVYIDAGNYSEPIIFEEAIHGDGNGYIEIRGAGSDRTTLSGNGEYNLVFANTSKIRVSNLMLKNGNASNVIIDHSSEIAIDRCCLSNTSDHSVKVINTPNVEDINIELSRLFIQNTSEEYGIYLENADKVNIYKCMINAGNGIWLKDSRYCKIYSNMISGRTGLLAETSSSSCQFYFNSFNSSKQCMYFVDKNSSNNWDMRNNLFFVTEGSCLHFESGYSEGFNRLGHNLYWYEGGMLAQIAGEEISDLESWQNSGVNVANGEFEEQSVFDDPRLEVVGNGLLYLVDESPATGGGQAIDGIDTDFNDGPFDIEAGYPIGASQIIRVTDPNPYSHVRQKPDGETYHFKNEYIKFVYNNEYPNASSNEKLQYKIYDADGEVVYQTGSISSWNENIHQGINYIEWKAPNCGGLMGFDYNLLEITNSKNEKWYLKFRIDKIYTVISMHGHMVEVSLCTDQYVQNHSTLFGASFSPTNP